MFVHSIVFVQDLYSGLNPDQHTNTNQYVQNVSIYTGNDSDYTANKLCPGGPFMIVGDYASSYKEIFLSDGSSRGNMWNYGAEVWCNQPG